MNVFLTVAGALSFLIAIVSATVIVMRSPGDVMRQWLASFLLFAALWGVIINFQNSQASLEYNLWIVRLTFIAAILMGYAMLQFAASVAQVRLSKITVTTLGLATAIMVLVGISDLSIRSVAIHGALISPDRQPTYYLIVLFILLLAGVSVAILLRAHRRTADRLLKARLGLITIGLSQGIILGALTNIILPNVMHSIQPARFAWVSLMLWTGILIYAVVRHHFLDIRLAVVRSVAYFLVLATLGGFYVIVAVLLSELFKGALFDPLIIVLNLSATLLFAIILQPLKHFFDRLTNKIFYRDNYSSDAFFERLSKEISATTDLRSLLQRAAREIGNTFNAEQSFLAVQYGAAHHHVTAGTSKHSRLSSEELELINAFAMTNDGAAIVTDLLEDQNEIVSMLTRRSIAVVLPLQWGRGTLSYLFLGPHRSREYTKRDIRVLGTVADELAIAIQNALSLHDVTEINTTLQDRIAEATKELRDSNQQLQRLDEAKDEFVSMASHQLRTPLTSVKGYISMVLEGDVGKISPMQRQLLGEAFTSSERMVHLINDFLNVSRLQTGKFMVDRRAIDLAKIIGQEVESLQTTANAHSMKLRYRAPAYFPTLYIDEGKIRQVVMNFIDNAIYYSREHTAITVKLYIDNGDAVLEVHDTGIGVPEAERAHLFTKFFRATNARKQRPDGTGVGLFLAKKVIVAHGGSIVFDSVEGEGSTFGFRLPVKKLSNAPTDDTDKLD